MILNRETLSSVFKYYYNNCLSLGVGDKCIDFSQYNRITDFFMGLIHDYKNYTRENDTSNSFYSSRYMEKVAFFSNSEVLNARMFLHDVFNYEIECKPHDYNHSNFFCKVSNDCHKLYYEFYAPRDSNNTVSYEKYISPRLNLGGSGPHTDLKYIDLYDTENFKYVWYRQVCRDDLSYISKAVTGLFCSFIASISLYREWKYNDILNERLGVNDIQSIRSKNRLVVNLVAALTSYTFFMYNFILISDMTQLMLNARVFDMANSLSSFETIVPLSIISALAAGNLIQRRFFAAPL